MWKKYVTKNERRQNKKMHETGKYKKQKIITFSIFTS